jgi:hypothetical protein
VVLVESAPAASVSVTLVESAPESLADDAAASGAPDGAELEPEHATPNHAPSSIAAIAGRHRATDTVLILLEKYTNANDGRWHMAASIPL